MFSGIVETTSVLEKVSESDRSLHLTIACPEFYDDLKIGDSIAVDGVCLTLEKWSKESGLEFTVGSETLRILNWSQNKPIPGKKFNLERSLRFGDRIHGHLVTGHVETTAQIIEKNWHGVSLYLRLILDEDFEIPSQSIQCGRFIWIKGSLSINGVSLTVNEVERSSSQNSQKVIFSVTLIPETLKRTNLVDLSVGDRVNIESDYLAKTIYQTNHSRFIGESADVKYDYTK